jgi:Patatin-like phospholipase
MINLFKIFMIIFFTKLIRSGRIVGNISGKNMLNYYSVKFQESQSQNIITNKNNLIYCEKDKELFLEDNNFIKNKKLISISPGGLKGFYELGVLSYIKDNYDMDKYIFSGASAGSWNALFMCFKKDTKHFVYTLLDYKLSQINNIKELEYFLKYKLLSNYNNDDFDLRRLFIGVTTIKRLKPATNIFSDFNSLEDAINCCIASSHIPLVTGGLTNRYHDMYTFDGGFSNYPYLNFTENVLHITPSMWKKLNNNKISANNKPFLDSFTSVNVILELFLMIKNRNYMELFDNGYLDAKNNKELLDKVFLEIENESERKSENDDDTTLKYPNSHLDLSKDNDSY